MIFGWDLSYEKLLESAGLETLKIHRERRVIKFAKKSAESNRFSALWFEINETEVNTRNPNKYKEKKTKTQREHRNPVTYYTKKLNWEHKKEKTRRT